MLEKIFSFERKNLISVALAGAIIFSPFIAGCERKDSNSTTIKQKVNKNISNFSENLPNELAQVCVLYANTKVGGDESERLAYAKAGAYFRNNLDDPRAAYLAGYGATTLIDYVLAMGIYAGALKIGLPEKQKTLVNKQIKGFGTFYRSNNLEEKLEALFSNQGAIRKDIIEISKNFSFNQNDMKHIDYPLDCNRALHALISEERNIYYKTSAAELEFAPYSDDLFHSSKAKSVSNRIFEEAINMKKRGEYLQISGLQATGLRFLCNFIDSKYRSGRTIEAFNGIGIFMNQIEDGWLSELGPNTLRFHLEYCLGEKESTERFLAIGKIISKGMNKFDLSSYDSRAREYWENLIPEEREFVNQNAFD